MRSNNDPALRSPSALIDDRPDEGVFEVHPRLYSDPGIFELEIEHIFNKTWVYLGHESQLPGLGHFFTSKIGRTPVLVVRTKEKINGFLNVCRHKGSLLCRAEQGKAKVFTCPYHQWSYANTGELIGMKDRSVGEYPASFHVADHDLLPLARLDSYQGLIFGSLSEAVPTLHSYLGDMRTFIDIALGQGENGMEVIPGRAPYSFRANWKMQLDNGLDPYHVTSAHLSLLNLQKQRTIKQETKTVRSVDWKKRETARHHAFNFPNGHCAYVAGPAEPEMHPLYDRLPELRARLGDDKADAMLSSYQLHIFPNLQIATTAAAVVRRFNPVSVNETEMDVRCLGVVGESPKQRSVRLRGFEDFFGAAGLASPDDSAIYEDCQRGFCASGLAPLQGYSRGAVLLGPGANAEATRFGVTPDESLSSSALVTAEINMRSPYREWGRVMDAGLRKELAYA